MYILPQTEEPLLSSWPLAMTCAVPRKPAPIPPQIINNLKPVREASRSRINASSCNSMLMSFYF